MVEGAGFQQMLKSFNPGYTIPSRTHFAKLLVKKYNATVDQVKSSISAIDSKVALTADIWTSVATEAYLGITCHYIGIDWQMESICLSTMPLEERHTAQNIAGWLEEILDKFEILPDKISAIVHDNGANIVAAARLLEEKYGWASLRCTGHTLQLVLTSALKHQIIAKADSFKVQVKVQMKAVEMEQLPSPCVQHHRAPDSTPPAPEKEEAKEGEAEELSRKVRQEVLTYFGEKPIPKGENPLEWWKLNEILPLFFQQHQV
ncbi:unnamed protein product [Leuciscus chuanchicus]